MALVENVEDEDNILINGVIQKPRLRVNSDISTQFSTV